MDTTPIVLIAVIAVVFAATLPLACCMLSSQISQWEEYHNDNTL